MKWTKNFDMTSIPDDVLYGEVGRRRSVARGDNVGGRPEVLHRCPHCKEKFGLRRLRAHMPRCPKKPAK